MWQVVLTDPVSSDSPEAAWFRHQFHHAGRQDAGMCVDVKEEGGDDDDRDGVKLIPATELAISVDRYMFP